jgi:A/G-specific adenine glycosylase
LNWTAKLLLWYSENKRSFIWRTTKDPYKIWLSEIILQQTRTAQGLPYYEKFITTFPSLSDLALAKEDEVLKLWQGLGYYSRARNLHATAQYIHFECKGVFPNSFKALLKLKGIGDYTASAIASICFDIPEAVVDGNVYRFLSRFFGIETPINSSGAHKQFKAKAMELLDINEPGTFNQALMEFGSTQCVPRSPNCTACPFVQDCIAFNQNKIHLLPVKTSKIKIVNRHFNYLIILDPKGNCVMEQRTKKGIWQQLFQFPLVESQQTITSPTKLTQHEDFPRKFSTDINQVKLWNEEPVLHKLSHQNLFVRFWILEYDKELTNGYPQDHLQRLAVPVVIQKFMANFFSFAI